MPNDYVKFPNLSFDHNVKAQHISFIRYNYFLTNGASTGTFTACSVSNKGYNNYEIVTISQIFIFK